MPTTTIEKIKGSKESLDYNLGNGKDTSIQDHIKTLPATPDEGLIKGFEAGRRARIIGTNMAGESVDDFARQFERNAASRPDLEQSVMKITIHLKPGENLPSHSALKSSLKLVKKLGYGNCPYIIVEHREKDHQHYHILVSTIDFDGKAISDKKNYQTSRAWAQETEAEYNLTPTAEKSARKQLTKAQTIKAERTKEFPAFYQLQGHIDEAVKNTASDFIRQLEAAEVSVKFLIEEKEVEGIKKKEVKGISYSCAGHNFGGRHLGTDFTWKGLKERGLSYEPERDDAEMAAASERASQKTSDRVSPQSGTELKSGAPKVRNRAAKNEQPAAVVDEAAGSRDSKLQKSTSHTGAATDLGTITTGFDIAGSDSPNLVKFTEPEESGVVPAKTHEQGAVEQYKSAVSPTSELKRQTERKSSTLFRNRVPKTKDAPLPEFPAAIKSVAQGSDEVAAPASESDTTGSSATISTTALPQNAGYKSNLRPETLRAFEQIFRTGTDTGHQKPVELAGKSAEQADHEQTASEQLTKSEISSGGSTSAEVIVDQRIEGNRFESAALDDLPNNTNDRGSSTTVRTDLLAGNPVLDAAVGDISGTSTDFLCDVDTGTSIQGDVGGTRGALTNNYYDRLISSLDDRSSDRGADQSSSGTTTTAAGIWTEESAIELEQDLEELLKTSSSLRELFDDNDSYQAEIDYQDEQMRELEKARDEHLAAPPPGGPSDWYFHQMEIDSYNEQIHKSELEILSRNDNTHSEIGGSGVQESNIFDSTPALNIFEDSLPAQVFRPSTGHDIHYLRVIELALQSKLINESYYRLEQQQFNDNAMRCQLVANQEFQFKPLLEIAVNPCAGGSTSDLVVRGYIANPALADQIPWQQSADRQNQAKSFNMINQDFFSPTVEGSQIAKSSLDLVTTIIKAHDFDDQKSWSKCEEESRDWLKRNFREDEVNGAEDAHQLGRLSRLESGRFFEDEEGELKAKKSAQAETEKQKAVEIIPFEI